MLSFFSSEEDCTRQPVTLRNSPSTDLMMASDAFIDLSSTWVEFSVFSQVDSIALLITPTFSEIRRPVSPERVESLRTSSATTAKPRPASPARAASMAALRARRLVCAAMLATSAAIVCSSEMNWCRLWTLSSIVVLLAMAERSESSTEPRSSSLRAKTATSPLLPPSTDSLAELEAVTAASSFCTIPEKRPTSEEMATSIWLREFSMWRAQTGATCSTKRCCAATYWPTACVEASCPAARALPRARVSSDWHCAAMWRPTTNPAAPSAAVAPAVIQPSPPNARTAMPPARPSAVV